MTVKQLISAFLGILMALSLCACTSAEPEQTTAAVPATTDLQTQPQEKDPQLGVFQNGVYTNDFLGITCRVDNTWSVYSDAQLAQLNGLVLDTMTDADLVEQLKNSNVAHLFYAAADNGHRSVNIVLENVGLINGVLLDEKSYIALSAEQLPGALQSMGLTDVTAEETTVRFAGKTHAAITVQGFSGGIPLYEQTVCIKAGSYFGLVTVASYHEDATEELLKMFSAG